MYQKHYPNTLTKSVEVLRFFPNLRFEFTHENNCKETPQSQSGNNFVSYITLLVTEIPKFHHR